MDDLISRNTLKKSIGESTEPFNTASVYRAIDNAPAVEAAEVRHGEWIDTGEDDGNGNYLFHCSSCGYSDAHSKSVEVPYCWHCGARMDD